MSNALLSLFVAAGISGFVYSHLGRRVGYSNTRSLWGLLAATFAFTFIIVLILLAFVLKLHSL
jgi:hypothetical protein